MGLMEKLSASLKQVKDPVVRERLLMVQASFRKPLREVAKDHGCVHGKVDFWKKRYEKHGLCGLATKSRSGRPKLITLEQERKMKKQVRKHDVKQGWKTKQVRQLIAKEANVKYSFRHTIRIIQSWGLSKIKPRPKYAFSKTGDREEFIKKTKDFWHVNH